jgi:methyl-accepting chemotaxis protein WspA
MKLTLKRKVIALTLFAAFLPILVLSILIYVQKLRIRDTVDRELKGLVRENAERVAKDVYIMCKATNALIQTEVNRNLNVARSIVEQQGGIQELPGETVAWTAVNQFTKKSQEVKLPKFAVGKTWLGQNRNLSALIPAVDDVTALVGGTCTIFQRMNEAGDMLRVATNVKTLEGERAIGTYIPAKMPPDDRGKVEDNPVVSAVLRGERYEGPAFVVNDWYLTAYEPILDAQGKIVGMLYVGVLRDAVASLNKAIKEIVVGKTGYVYVLDGSGENRGEYIIAKKGSNREGENIWDSKDDDGSLYIQEAIEKAVSAGDGNCDFQSYPWVNREIGETKARTKTAAVIYFQPWDWVIGAGAYDDDYKGLWDEAEDALLDLQISADSAGLGLMVLVGIIAFVFGGRIAGPITKITGIAQVIASGDLLTANESLKGMTGAGGEEGGPTRERRRGTVRAKDETGQLLAATSTMAGSLSSLVGQVQRSGIQVTTSSTEIAASAKQLEATTTEQAAATSQVVATATEISATSGDLAKTMDEVTSVASQTADLADAGRNDLAGMEQSMRQLAQATHSISSRLSAINEKANNISSVVTTINKVADQTNLLSLNAAIEAEKAGEYGQGFSVVAREIRRLADQSAIATLDIEQMVAEMQSAVSAGVMEMDKFNTEVRRSVEEMARISQQQTQIIEQVQALMPRFETVNTGMQTQSEGARQISESMVQLNEAAQQTAASLREFNKVIEQLNMASRGLQDEVSHFRVSA